MTTEWTVRSITRATLPVLLALMIVELVSGFVLDGFESTLFRYPSLLILVPVVIGSAGNLASVLAARLSTALHLGTLSFGADDTLLGNALATIALAFTVFPVIGIGAWILSLLTAGVRLPFVTVVLIATTSGAVLAVLTVVITVVTTYAAYRLRLDPDDVVIPIVTNVCDVLGVLVLFVVAQIII